MEGREHWNIYFKDYKNPCFITNKDTGDFVYCNNEFEKLLGCTQEVVGKPFSEVINMREVHLTSDSPNWDLVDTFETESYNKRTHRRYTLKSSKMECGQDILCEMIPQEHSLFDNLLFEKAAENCMSIWGGEDEKIFPDLMKLVAEFYDAKNACIYRFDYKSKKMNCLAQWGEENSIATKENADQEMDASKTMAWLQEQNSAGIVSISNRQIVASGSIEEQLLSKYRINNITLCNIEDANHKVVGVICVSDRKDETKFLDRRLLHTVSRLVAQEVGKDTIESDMFALYHTDLLTGCYNRTGYAKMMDMIMSKKPGTMGVVSVNINGLRNINETQGIEKGDAHIQKSAQRLQKHFDFDFYRMSGHEFLGVAPDVKEKEFEEQINTLHHRMREERNFDFSLGHTWRSGNINVMKMSHDAEEMMYINKQQYYSEAKRVSDAMRNEALVELLDKIDKGAFTIYLQPQVWLKDGSLYGAEALIRTYDKEFEKMVFPDKFIPQYEDKSVIRHLDLFVLESVCKLQQEWIKAGKRVPISVNFSRVTLQEYGIVDAITAACKRYEIPHDLVVIEITERVGLINNSVASTLVQQFKDNGFNLSLDDFGCAYSNIITLAQIEVDEIKIDKSLVDFILSNEKNRLLVKGILDMCEGLQGTSTVAEGIESQEQSDMLHELGCGLGQGYHYSRLIPIVEFEQKYINI